MLKPFPILVVLFLACFASLSLCQNGITVFHLELYGANEVYSPGDPDGYGVATISYDSVTTIITYEICVQRISEPTAISINSGSEFTGTSSDNNVFVGLLIFGRTKIESKCYGEYKITGTTSSDLSDVIADPWKFYLQIYTAEYENGAIRGQLITPQGSAAVSYSDVNLFPP